MRTLETRLTSPLGFAAVIAAAMLAWTFAFTGGASADGNNGTVKIHNADEPTPEVRTEPHVCPEFHLHFFFGDPGQPGVWEVRSWPDGALADAGSYTADGNGEAEADASATPGHYRLFWQGDDDKNFKHKTFKVHECDNGGDGGGGG